MWKLNSFTGLPERTEDEEDGTNSEEAVSSEFNTSKFGNFLEVCLRPIMASLVHTCI